MSLSSHLEDTNFSSSPRGRRPIVMTLSLLIPLSVAINSQEVSRGSAALFQFFEYKCSACLGPVDVTCCDDDGCLVLSIPVARHLSRSCLVAESVQCVQTL